MEAWESSSSFALAGHSGALEHLMARHDEEKIASSATTPVNSTTDWWVGSDSGSPSVKKATFRRRSIAAYKPEQCRHRIRMEGIAAVIGECEETIDLEEENLFERRPSVIIPAWPNVDPTQVNRIELIIHTHHSQHNSRQSSSSFTARMSRIVTLGCAATPLGNNAVHCAGCARGRTPRDHGLRPDDLHFRRALPHRPRPH